MIEGAFVLASLCAGVVYAAGTVPSAVEDAVNAGKTMPIPDFDVITKGEDVSDCFSPSLSGISTWPPHELPVPTKLAELYRIGRESLW